MIRAIARSMLLLIFASMAFAEDVTPRTKIASTVTRIRGAQTVLPVPWGFVALGGPVLRQLPKGKSGWETLYRVEKDNLYRIAADDRGRLLAAWEHDANVHLFVPRTREHHLIPKPAQSATDFRTWALADLYFAGEDALVFMAGLTGNCEWTTVAFRCPLDGHTPPAQLFRQSGYCLHTSPRIAVFAVPKNSSIQCMDNGCWPMQGIFAYEIGAGPSARTTVLSGAGDRLSQVRMVWGYDDPDRAVMIVRERDNSRHLLRWRFGESAGEYRAIPKGLGWDSEATWLTKSGDVLEVWRRDDYGMEIRRYDLKATMTSTVLSPLMRGGRVRHDSVVYRIKERLNGDLVMQWCDDLVLLHGSDAPRLYDLEQNLKRGNEWAGAMMYDPDPTNEAVWVGIEIGGGRDYVRISLADADRHAAPQR